eukprot:TRINITY_DN187_c2_g1_i1.p1 TRINITY_DN187_c2_g1~~TRINITY_DN187_c2_g1_i1.p1  ORF type:complete len:337 (+),score=95.93 TRINITY_DN187_c2_g1_i1:49-1011(+)
MPRSSAAIMPKGVKKASKKPVKTSTPKRTPGRGAKRALMRDLHSMSDLVEQRVANVLKVCQDLGSLKGKVDVISMTVEDAQKEHDERVGKVERDILQYELQKVQDVLKNTNKLAVDRLEMDALRKLQRNKEDESVKNTKTLDKDVIEKVAELVRFKEVEFQNKYAECRAKEASMDAERRTLHATIASLRFEIESQKNLSSDIAKANQQKKINELRRKAIEDHQARELAKEDALLAQTMQFSGKMPVAAPAASTPVPRKKSLTKPVEASSESGSGSETDTDTEEAPKSQKTAPKKKEEITRQGSTAKKPAGKAAKKVVAKK